MILNSKQRKVLNYLKNRKVETSTSQVSVMCSLVFYKAQEVLESLYKLNLVSIRESESRFKYWSIKENKNEENRSFMET